MKLVSQLHIAFFVVLALGLASAGITLWNLQQSRIHFERLNVSHSVYETYLSLESHIYQLFKQYGDAIIIGDANQRAGKIELIQAIKTDIKAIRSLLTEEASLSDVADAVDDDNLAVIEETVKDLTTGLDKFSPTGTGEFAADWERLSRLLNEEIDGRFRNMVQSALQKEADKVAVIQRDIKRDIYRQRLYTTAFAVASLLAVMAVFATIGRKITQPINTLVAGVRRFSDGDFSTRINIAGKNELAEVSQAFDTMAQKVSAQNYRMVNEKDTLQQSVDDRTRQLSLMLEDIQRIDESRKRMIADVSHELRTPLTIIKGEADIALRGGEKSNAIYREALSKTRDAASHTARLVDDLLFVARAEAGEVRLNLGSIDLLRLLRETLDTFGREVKFYSSVVDAPMSGDAGRIGQAMLVLLENARHHGGDAISVCVSVQDKGYRVDVADNGPGMSDDEKEHAFIRFFRGSNAAARYSDGVGLGLPVALSIVQSHGGDITLHDNAGGGLLVSLFLPGAKLPEVAA